MNTRRLIMQSPGGRQGSGGGEASSRSREPASGQRVSASGGSRRQCGGVGGGVFRARHFAMQNAPPPPHRTDHCGSHMVGVKKWSKTLRCASRCAHRLARDVRCTRSHATPHKKERKCIRDRKTGPRRLSPDVCCNKGTPWGIKNKGHEQQVCLAPVACTVAPHRALPCSLNDDSKKQCPDAAAFGARRKRRREREKPPPHGFGVCIWMHLVNGTGNSPSPGQPTLG